MAGVAITLEHTAPISIYDQRIPDPAALAANPKMQRALKAVAELLREDAVQRFKRQTDPWGNAWAPLSSATVAARARRLGVRIHRVTGERRGMKRNLARAASMTILIDRGILMGGINARIDKLAVEVGVGGAHARIARAQQFGIRGPRRWGKAEVGPLPARPFLPVRKSGEVDLRAEIRAEIDATYSDAFSAVLRGALGV